MDKSWLAHLEKLAALDLTEAERLLLHGDLTRIINFAAVLQRGSDEVVVMGKPTEKPSFSGTKNSSISFSQIDFIAAAPDAKDGFLLTPPVWPLESEDGHD